LCWSHLWLQKGFDLYKIVLNYTLVSPQISLRETKARSTLCKNLTNLPQELCIKQMWCLLFDLCLPNVKTIRKVTNLIFPIWVDLITKLCKIWKLFHDSIVLSKFRNRTIPEPHCVVLFIIYLLIYKKPMQKIYFILVVVSILSS